MQTDTTVTIKNRTGYILIAVLLGLCFTISATLQAANFDSGVFEFQQKLAKSGNAQAQYQLATMYESGRGVSRDINKAKEWYKKSAAKNYVAASHRLTYLDVKTGGFKASHKPWLTELVNDAKKGNSEALFILGEMNENGIGVKKNLKKAQHYFKSSSAKGNVDAEHRLYDIEQDLKQQKAEKRRKQEAQKAKEAKAKEARAEEKAAKKRKEDQARKAREAKAKSKKNSQFKAEQERRQLEAERKQLAQKKHQLEAQQKTLQEKEAAAQKEKQKKADDAKFESDLCSGRAARFRTQCN